MEEVLFSASEAAASDFWDIPSWDGLLGSAWLWNANPARVCPASLWGFVLLTHLFPHLETAVLCPEPHQVQIHPLRVLQHLLRTGASSIHTDNISSFSVPKNT